jgi:hypothetical protein
MGDQPDRPDNTQHSQQANIHIAARFKPTPATEQPQTHALDLLATGRVYLVFLVNPTQGTQLFREKSLLVEKI